MLKSPQAFEPATARAQKRPQHRSLTFDGTEHNGDRTDRTECLPAYGQLCTCCRPGGRWACGPARTA
eukprot:5408267-Alexandrium_andersonii.AAC.1